MLNLEGHCCSPRRTIIIPTIKISSNAPRAQGPATETPHMTFVAKGGPKVDASGKKQENEKKIQPKFKFFTLSCT